MSEYKRVALTPDQQRQWINSIMQMRGEFVPALAHQGEGFENKKVFVVAFDGTWNDKEDPAFGPKTNPAQFMEALSKDLTGEKLAGVYFNGVGTRTGKFGEYAEGATGIGCEERAEQAFKAYREKAAEWLQADPNASIHVVVMGFSRGSASGRHFLNLVHERGIPTDDGHQVQVPDPYSPTGFSDKVDREYAGYLRNPGTITSSALLYDTVATGQENTLKLGIPPTTLSLAHFEAKDELRIVFPLTPVASITGDAIDERRFITLANPGAHSDQGGGYGEGTERLAKHLGELYLSKLGLPLEPQPLDLKGFSEGIHDSRYAATQLARDILGMEGRQSIHVENTPVPAETRIETLLEISANKALSARLELERVQSNPQKDISGLPQYSIQVTPLGNGEVHLHFNRPDMSFDEKTGAVKVGDQVVGKFGKEDYDRMDRGETFVHVYTDFRNPSERPDAAQTKKQQEAESAAPAPEAGMSM